MSSTSTLPPPNRPTGGVTPHGVEPSRVLTILGLTFLLIGFGVDLAAFTGALALVAGDLGDLTVWLLSAAAGLMALFLMFEAGYMESERRETTMGSHGKGIIRSLEGVWLLAGATATFIRLTAVPTVTGGAFDTAAAGGSDPFGGSLGDSLGGAAANGAIDLGFTTIFPEHIPTAVFMLVLYLGVGLGAYLFGRRFYRPLLNNLRSKRKDLAKQVKALDALRRERDDAVVNAAELRRTSDQIAAHHAEIAALRSLEAALLGQQDALDRRRALGGRRLGVEQAEARVATDLDALNGQVVTESRAAEAAGRAATQYARTLLHQHLADPSRTVMDDDVNPYDLPVNSEA